MTPEMDILTNRMDELDIQLFEAEKAGRVAEQVAVLRERARAWRDYGQILKGNGRDNVGAELSAQRDETHAFQLEGGAR